MGRVRSAIVSKPAARPWRSAGVALLVGASVSGCAGVSGDGVSSALVTPGKYEFYSCQDITNRIAGARSRMAELEQLMAKSSQGAGGALVNVIAYQSDYTVARGDLAILLRTAEEKKCQAESPWTSERAIF
jgi:hypothetical protein